MASLSQIPSWETAQLDSLAANGKLNGVSPIDLQAITLSEMNPAYAPTVNPQGFGGYFGTSVTDPAYGGNGQTILNSQSTSAYDLQAQVASGIFAQGLAQNGGNPLAAEAYYQGNPNGSGQSVFQQLGITSPQTVGPHNAVGISGQMGGSGGNGSTSSSSSNNSSSGNSGLSNPIFGVLGGPSIAGVGFFFLAIVLLLIGGLVLVAGTLKGKGGSMPIPA